MNELIHVKYLEQCLAYGLELGKHYYVLYYVLTLCLILIHPELCPQSHLCPFPTPSLFFSLSDLLILKKAFVVAVLLTFQSIPL